MTAKEVIEIVKESHLWASLTQKEKEEVITHALQMYHGPINEENLKSIIGEVFSDSEEL